MASTPLGAKLKQLRKAKGFSLEELANQTGMSKSYIWELENRPANPTTEKLSKLADALGVTTAYLTENTSELTDDVLQEAFFRKFNRLSDEDKKKIEQIIDLWGKKECL